MAHTAAELLDTTVAELAPDPGANRLVPLIARGAAGPAVLQALALEQRWVIDADRRAFLHLEQRAAEEPEAAAYFRLLAGGEELARGHLAAFAAACGVDEARSRAHRPRPGCQAYPAYVSWLALNASPTDAVLAITVNFSAWGGYCATIGAALRTHYGFSAEACAFFDFFARPAPDLDESATAAVGAGLATGRLDTHLAHTYGGLLQSYEALFWDTLLQTA
ncbi:transcriptional regulator [Streptomyces sp. MAA16]|uniref:transcriptional regulator n=1 Tax=Streptomyces sp. MAA16 TaxID=3035116 RepID=UPI0024746B77|nr:transcriptional regulator [Streptomyces sp. MAA16]MDH6697275.1 hypothetical protein [Streptomyces sp. MAA16]